MPNYKVAPLSGTFMMTSFIGLVISLLFVYQKLSKSFGIAFAIVFFIMFVSSLLSMHYSDPLKLLALDSNRYHEDEEYRKKLDEKLKKMKTPALRKIIKKSTTKTATRSKKSNKIAKIVGKSTNSKKKLR